MKLRIGSSSLLLGLLAAAMPMLVSCGPLESGGGNHKVVNAPGSRGLEARLREAANSYRRSNGKNALTRHAGLEEMARQHSEAMARSGKLSHAGDSTRHALAASKYQIRATAENVLRWPLQRGRDPQAILKIWIDSSGHRRNLLDPSYAVTGLGIAQDDQGNLWATQLFGWPPGTGRVSPGVGGAW